MARSHHRKKHKQHLQQFKHSSETNTTVSKSKTSATWVFGIAGAVLGFAVSYFATGGDIIWMAAGLLVGSVGGYLIGKKIDGKQAG